MSYTIQSNKINKNRVFILNKSQLEKRLDPFYYIPELLELEKKVLARQPKKLRDYVVGISSGATPKTTEVEKYYGEKENGIPFLRVQNLSPTGILEFDDCKYINKETHDGMLKRSQVEEGDLLVKITGVGRMAVASVAPEGFEGNINQHICVIRTGSKEKSELLASFLNSDIGEKLASRRATGGTRPALDYPALLSIPIIEDQRILEITRKVVAQKRQNETEAEKLLGGIDDYLLGELGIELPEPPESTLARRIYFSSLKEVSTSRFDSNYYQQYHKDNFSAIQKSTFKTDYLKRLTYAIFQGVGRNIDENSNSVLLKVKNIRLDGQIDFEDVEKIGNYPASKILKSGDVITPCIGEAVRQIKFAVFENDKGSFLVDNNTGVIRPSSNILPHYLNYCLKSSIGKVQILRLIGGGGVPFLGADNLKKFVVPLPPLEKQKEIAEHISAIRQQAQALKNQTAALLKKASEEIEKLILNPAQ